MFAMDSLVCCHLLPSAICELGLVSCCNSSSVVTLARPPTSSFLKVTDRSFCYASPCLLNQLLSVHQPHSRTSFSASDSPVPSPSTSSSIGLPVCLSITPTLFYSLLKRLKATCFTNPSPIVSLLFPDCLSSYHSYCSF